jgi:hypothetical protein
MLLLLLTPEITSLDRRLAKSDDFSLGGRRDPNITEYRSISTHGISTSIQGVFATGFAEAFVFAAITAACAGSGISGVVS